MDTTHTCFWKKCGALESKENRPRVKQPPTVFSMYARRAQSTKDKDTVIQICPNEWMNDVTLLIYEWTSTLCLNNLHACLFPKCAGTVITSVSKYLSRPPQCNKNCITVAYLLIMRRLQQPETVGGLWLSVVFNILMEKKQQIEITWQRGFCKEIFVTLQNIKLKLGLKFIIMKRLKLISSMTAIIMVIIRIIIR